MERTGAPDIFSLVRIYRLRWSGHVCRIEDGRLPKDIFYGQLPSAPRPVQTPLQGRTKKRFKGTQHKYGKLGTIDNGACSLALPSSRQTSIFDPNVHHRLQSSPNWSSDTTGKVIEREATNPQTRFKPPPMLLIWRWILLLSRPANTWGKKPITQLKPWIYANATDTSEKVKICIVFLLFYSN